MDIKIIKKKDGRVDRNTGLLITERLRVTAYARVSTGNEEQLNSYESQKKYYKEKISSNDEWQYIDMYADEAISGTLDYKRNDFMKMIHDGINGKFDMIITKSISRFARNTVDTLKYVRKLKENNVAVFFEEENINTLEMSGELLLTILSSVAQQESETISSHVKLGLKMKKERGELIGFNNCYGYVYDSDNNKMIIKENEADIVKMMFRMYLDGRGADYIAKQLTKMGIKSPKGKDVWGATTVRGILTNEKYKGDVLQGKTFTQDPISHRRLVNYGEEDKYYISNHHEAIISVEDFDKVQEILKAKCGARATGRRLGNVGGKYTMSSRLRCGFCGETLGRRTMFVNQSKKVAAWQCIESSKNGKYNCPDGKIVKEEIIENAFIDIYQLLANNRNNIIDSISNIVKNSMRNGTTKEKLDKLKEDKIEYENKISKLVDLMVDGTIDSEMFKNKKATLLNKIEKMDKEIEQLQLVKEDDDEIERGIIKLKEMLNSDKIFNIEKFDEQIFDALIDYVIIGGYNEKDEKDSYLIRFICKKSFNFTPKKDITKEMIKKNNNLNNTDNYITILDVISNQRFNIFEKDKNGSRVRKTIENIRVRLELER